MHRVFVFLLSLLLLVACSGDPQVAALLDRVDRLTYEQPDSALRLLQQHEAEASAWPRSQQMRHALLTARAQNKAFVDFTTDSMLLELTDYYDRHGTPNQQMEAHYLLGCVYRDLGEAPQALQYYQDALDIADAIGSTCSQDVLLGILGQMSFLFHQQYLPHDELYVRERHLHYAIMMNDSVEYAFAKAQMIKPFYLLGKMDSVLTVIDETYEFYKEHGLQHIGSQYLPPAIYIYTTRHQYEKARQLMNIYESESGLFDSCGNIAKGREHYYYTKGFYYQNMEMIDSAEYLYRKFLEQGNNSADAYRGLLAIYHKRHNPDSIAKFAFLFESALDSLHHNMEQQALHRMSSQFNYNRYQKEALDNAEKAHVANIRFIVLAALLVLLAAGAAYFVKRNRKRREEQNARYHVAIVERNKLQKEVESLNAKDYESVITQKEQEIALLNQTIERQSTIYHRVTVSDRLSDFEKSRIVQVFLGKRTYHKELTVPTGNEWKALVSQFRQDMPSAYATMSSLSPLQLQVCVLLILGFEEGEIAYLRQTKPQVINTAKVRANQKLFLSNDSASLKDNLMGIITSC